MRSAGSAATSSCTSCGSGSGRTCTPSCETSARDLGLNRKPNRPLPSGCTPPRSPACCPTSAWPICARRSRTPAARPAQAAPTHVRSGSTSAPAGTRFAINPGSSLAPGPATAGGRGRDRRDHPAVGPDRRRGQGRAGRGGRRGHLLKRTYSEPHWSSRCGLGAGVRAGDAVRRSRSSPVAGSATPGSIRPRLATSSSARHSSRALADPAPLLRAQRRGPGRGRGAGGEGAAARPDGRRRGDLRLLRSPDPGRGDRCGPVRQLVEDRAPGDARAAGPRPWTTLSSARSRGEDAFPTSWMVERPRARWSATSSIPARTRTGSASTIPLALLNQIDAAPFSWQVPGLRRELAAELIRTLPKDVRRQLVPGDRVRRSGPGLARPTIRGRTGAEATCPRALEPGRSGPSPGCRPDDWRTGRRAAPSAGAVRDHRWRRFDREAGPGSDSAEGATSRCRSATA